MPGQARARIGPLIAIGALLLGGCSQAQRVRLKQPFAPPTQRDLELTSHWAWSGAQDGRAVYLLEFPLPRAVTGFRAFHIYLTTPAPLGDFELRPDDPHAAQGFFIQEVGELAGKVTFTGGSLRVRNALLRPNHRSLQLDLHADRGFRLSGSVLVREDPAEIRRFARDFAGDVERLVATAPPEPPPPPQPGETARRAAAAAAPPPPDDAPATAGR